MADWTNPPDVVNNTLADASQIQIAYNNTIAAFEGAANAPRLDIRALPNIEIINRINSGLGARFISFNFNNDFSREQIPVAIYPFNVTDINGDELRQNYPQIDTLLQIPYFYAQSGLDYNFIFYNAVSHPTNTSYFMSALIFYQNREI